MCSISLGKHDQSEVDPGTLPGVPGSAPSQPFTDPEQEWGGVGWGWSSVSGFVHVSLRGRNMCSVSGVVLSCDFPS